jgi:hypothetical protein
LHQLRAGTPGPLAAATSEGATEGVASEGLSQRVMVYAVSTPFVLVLASEVLGRVLFYTSNVRIGF